MFPKIFKASTDEFILTNKEGEFNKLKGKHAEKIVEVLKQYQITTNQEEIYNNLINKIDIGFINSAISWLITNGFIEIETTPISKNIVFIGDLLDKDGKIKHLLSDNFNIVDVLSKSTLKNYDAKTIDLVVIVGPLWYDKSFIDAIATFMNNFCHVDFLYIETHRNGITLGPLMNLDKNTLCLNCLYQRKISNSFQPDVIIETIFKEEIEPVNRVATLDIGNFKIHQAFITNELIKILDLGVKNLYNKSVFIDYLSYHNQYFKVLKANNCKVCNEVILYNPL